LAWRGGGEANVVMGWEARRKQAVHDHEDAVMIGSPWGYEPG